ncbi:MAG: S8 family serine peptidase [Chromatiales bacterium]|nr:S8 family serine peptidase [Chromatiales bacterium]
MSRRGPLLLLCCALLAAAPAGASLRSSMAGLPASMPEAGPGDLEPRTYIIQLADPPAVQRPDRRQVLPGERAFDPGDPEVVRYAGALVDRHDALLRSVGAFDAKIYSYRYTFNGFAARLTPFQARKLASRRDVVNVWEDRIKYVETNASPGFLGLEGAGGIWGIEGLRGEGVIIGVIDSGITPEHPSFSDRRGESGRPRLCRSSWAENSLLGVWLCRRFRQMERELVYGPPAGWRGSCEAGERFRASDCNNKLIGARFYIDAFLQRLPLDNNEFISPRDADGHGTHIAATAAGNRVRASIGGSSLAWVGGVAPRARIASYKACWLEPGQIRGSCSTADLQRAIEDAVADGVHIINYSVGSSNASIRDPDDLALLAALEAGVLAVVAAGNDGPFEGSVLSPAGAPWVLTVGAASRQGQRFDEAVEITAPASLSGRLAAREASFTPALRQRGPLDGQLVLVDDGVRSVSGDGIGSIHDGCQTLVNAEAVRDNIAFIQRGGCDFQTKLRNAELAGARAVVVYNNQGAAIVMAGQRGSTNLPAVMIGQEDGERLFDALRSGSVVEIKLDKRLFLATEDPGNVVAAFSSRGPNLVDANLLKPDLVAPGVDILAAQTRDVANGVRGENFQYLSGTSMAVPHVAGLAALLRQAQPDWGPDRIKSALMTTARQDLGTEETELAADPFAMGAGHVVPASALSPGLVYETSIADFDAYLCGRGAGRVDAAGCSALAAAGHPTDPVQLNLPSLAIDNLVSTRSVRRTVTNVGQAAQYFSEVDAPAGISVEVVPPLLSLDHGESASFELLFTAGSEAAAYEWAFGALRWSNGEQLVHSPIALRTLPFSAPLSITGTGPAGSATAALSFGYEGSYQARVHGLAPAAVFSRTVSNDPENFYEFLPQPPAHVARVEFQVPSGTLYLRIATFDEATSGEDDLDLYVYYCPVQGACTGLVDVSGEATSEERVDIVLPLPGWYLVDVHGFETEGPQTSFDLFVWQFGEDDDRGNLGVSGAPSNVSAGDRAELLLEWSLDTPGRYLGAVTHNDAEGALDLTLVEITVPGIAD